MTTIMAALYFHALRPQDKVAVKPHAGPILHVIHYLLGKQSLDRMVSSFERLEKVAPKLELALDEIGKLARDVRLFIPEIKKTNDRIQNLIGEVGPPLPPGAAVAQEQPEQATLRTLVREIQELVRTIRPAVDDIRGSIGRLEPEVTGATRSARQTFDRASVAFDGLNDVLSPENRKQFAELLRNLNTIGVNIIKRAVEEPMRRLA